MSGRIVAGWPPEPRGTLDWTGQEGAMAFSFFSWQWATLRPCGSGFGVLGRNLPSATHTHLHSFYRSSCYLFLKTSIHRMECVLNMPHAHLHHPDLDCFVVLAASAADSVTEEPLQRKIDVLFASLK